MYPCCEHCDHDPGWEHLNGCLHCDDPPEVDPDDAEAQRIAETYADAADEYRAIEAGEW